MKKYELGLGRNYVADWNVWSGIREFIQNAIDQSKTIEDNKMSIDYDEDNQVLKICNKKSVLEHHTLLLGNSSKKDDGKTIGMFGEGYKLALLVLTREGKNVTIYNYGKREVWTARFSKLKKYDYVETLIVEVDTAFPWTKIPNNDLTVQIEGITPDEFEIVRENTLMLKGDYIYYPTKFGNILEGEQFSGEIYINGLKVCDKPEFKYGYDIKPAYLKIGRDRNLIDSYDIQRVARRMWLLSGKKEIIKDFMNQSTYKDCEGISYETNWYPNDDIDIRTEAKNFADEVFEDYISEYGDETLCARDEKERTKLQRTYKNKKVVVISNDMGNMITNSFKYETMISNIEISEQTMYDKIMNWASTNYVGESSMNALFDIIQPLVDVYEEKTGESFFEQKYEEKVV